MPFDGDVKRYEVVTKPRRVTRTELMRLINARLETGKDWTQGKLRHGNRVCILGAFESVALDLGWDFPRNRQQRNEIFDAFAKNMMKLPGIYKGLPGHGAVIAYNDHVGRRFSDVKKTLVKSERRARRRDAMDRLLGCERLIGPKELVEA